MTEALPANNPKEALHFRYLNQIGEAGWLSAGGVWVAAGHYDINEGSVLPRFVRCLDDRELVTRLGLTDDEGTLAPGYEVSLEVEGVFLGYEGPLSAHYIATLGMMARLARPDMDMDDPGADVLCDPVEVRAYRETYEALASRMLQDELSQ